MYTILFTNENLLKIVESLRSLRPKLTCVHRLLTLITLKSMFTCDKVNYNFKLV